MVVIFIRTLITYITLVVVMRIMGKRQIGEMQPFEFIVTLIIADLACIPMTDVSIPLVYGIVSILALFLLHQLFSILEQSSDFCKKALSGKPSVVINKNGVDMLELKKNNLDLSDLIESMRIAGYFSLDDVSYAMFEANGKLSALESDKEKSKSIPLLIIGNGKISLNNVRSIGESRESLTAFLKENGTSLNKTEVLTIDGNGRAYLKCKNQKYKILSFPLKGGIKW